MSKREEHVSNIKMIVERTQNLLNNSENTEDIETIKLLLLLISFYSLDSARMDRMLAAVGEPIIRITDAAKGLANIINKVPRQYRNRDTEINDILWNVADKSNQIFQAINDADAQATLDDAMVKAFIVYRNKVQDDINSICNKTATDEEISSIDISSIMSKIIH